LKKKKNVEKSVYYMHLLLNSIEIMNACLLSQTREEKYDEIII